MIAPLRGSLRRTGTPWGCSLRALVVVDLCVADGRLERNIAVRYHRLGIVDKFASALPFPCGGCMSLLSLNQCIAMRT